MRTLKAGIAAASTMLLTFPANAQRTWDPSDSVAAQYYVADQDSVWSVIGGGNPVVLSPDGTRFFVITTRGELTCDCNYSDLRVYDVEAIERGLQAGANAVAPTTSLTLHSAFNARYMLSARWTDANDHIAFLGPANTGATQVYRFSVATTAVEKLTNVESRAGVLSFEMRGDALIFYAQTSETPRGILASYPSAVVGAGDLLEPLLGIPTYTYANFASLSGRAPVQLGPASANGYPATFWISPDENSAIAHYYIDQGNFPGWWCGYRPDFAPSGPASECYEPTLSQYWRVNLETGSQEPLLPTPTARATGNSTAQEVLWYPDSSGVIVSNALVPTEHGALDQRRYVLDMRFGHRYRVVAPIDRDGFRPASPFLRWVQAGTTLGISYNARNGSLNGASSGEQTIFTRRDGLWRASPHERGSSPADTETPSVTVVQDANTAPTLVASFAGRRLTLIEQDPALQNIEWHRVQTYEWQDERGRTWTGGLTLPSGNPPSVPLIIQASYFEPEFFLPDGSVQSGFAAQALASRGFAVLQLRIHDAEGLTSPREGPSFVEGVDAAVASLAASHHIDSERVGLIGFSRGGMLTTYAATNPGRFRLAAAISDDGHDKSYVQYLQSIVTGNSQSETENFLGGGPFWERRQDWLDHAPGFNLDRVRMPLLMTTHGRQNVNGEVEFLGGMSRLHKPFEYVVFPDAEHQLKRPRERLAAMQMTIDWMSFWLNGTERPDTETTAQYVRWRSMRDDACREDATRAFCRH